MNTQKIDDLVTLYEKRLATLRSLKSLIEGDPELASEVLSAFALDCSATEPPKRASRTKKAGQYEQMLELMRDGEWRTLDEIAAAIDAKKHSIAPYLYRDDNKDKFEKQKHPDKLRMIQWRLKQPDGPGESP